MSDSVHNPASYQPPVDALLTLGKKYVQQRNRNRWHNYVKSFGFTNANIPELIRMALDDNLNEGDANSDAVWAPIHAWRSLGQLHSTAAIDPLLNALEAMEDDDFFREDLPTVLALIGPEAIPSLTRFITDSNHTLYPKWTCIRALTESWKTYPEVQADCLAVIVEQLQQFQKNNETVNAVLINALIDMQATETADLIKQAYAAKRVDLSILGDWIDAQLHLKLISSQEAIAQRAYVDAEHLSQRAAQPISAEPRGFGASASAKKSSAKKKKKS